MSFHTTKRALTLATAASWWVLCIASPSVAQAEGNASEADTASDKSASKEGGGKQGASKEGGGEEKKPRNSVRLSFVYARQKGQRDWLGFEIAYERELIDEHLSIELAKPFLFSQDGVTSPTELTLKGLFVKGAWEGYIGFILAFNNRFLSSQRAEIVGRKNILSFGIGATIGGAYHFTERWSLELGCDYAYVIDDPVASHEYDLALGGVFHF